MNNQILLNQYAHGRMVGSRFVATPLRDQLEETLAQQSGDVSLDFSGIMVTQSFVDELIGVLLLKHGEDILKRLVFKGCSADVRAIIEFVATDRCDQYVKSHTH
ncbi:MAG: STAS-like domain-containing protein [Gallionella sp.]